MTKAAFDSPFDRLDAAIDAHPLLVRVSLAGKLMTKKMPVRFRREAEIVVARESRRASVWVKCKGKRGNATEISGRGESPFDAVEDLVAGMDLWAEVLS